MGTTVIQGQSLFDLAIQLHGSVEQAFFLALQNGLSITETLTPGMVIDKATDTTYHNTDVANYFAKNQRQIATYSSIPNSITNAQPSGIGQMIIEQTFTVAP